MNNRSLPLIEQAVQHRIAVAVVDADGAHSYQDLLDGSASKAVELLNGRADLEEDRIAFLMRPGFEWVVTQWGIWRAGGIAVPLPLGFPAAELDYLLDDAGPAALVTDSSSEELLAHVAATRGLRLLSSGVTQSASGRTLPEIDCTRRAMMLYTSGTTNHPKGVVTTHDNIAAQIRILVEAWGWVPDDRILLCLPLHHVHGIINVLGCALWSGATCDMLGRFDAETVWNRIADGELTILMAVPTIYAKLIAAWETSTPSRQTQLSDGCRRMRLMVSGSAALPVSTLERWKQLSGHTLLERYGMTEIGMALSNPLVGARVPGSVGRPLPGVHVRVVDESGSEVAPGTPGEIEVRGPSVFREYWKLEEATRLAFRDGWFRTGDIAVVEQGVYRISGRANIDILKTGGHKFSALEVEEALRAHSAIAECAVVGVPDDEWGERVGVAVVLSEGATLGLAVLRDWAGDRLAKHKIPSRLITLDALPRNAMGKVTKPAVVELFQAREKA